MVKCSSVHNCRVAGSKSRRGLIKFVKPKVPVSATPQSWGFLLMTLSALDRDLPHTRTVKKRSASHMVMVIIITTLLKETYFYLITKMK